MTELEQLKQWKIDALETMEDDNRAYLAQKEIIIEMHKVIADCADALHAAQMCISGWIEIKSNLIEKTKKVT